MQLQGINSSLSSHATWRRRTHAFRSTSTTCFLKSWRKFQKNFPRANACIFLQSELQPWVIISTTYQILLFLCWYLCFRCAFFYTFMEYFHIFYFANDPTNCRRVQAQASHPRQSHRCTTTSYLPLYDITKLQRIHGISRDNNHIDLYKSLY